MLHPAAFHVYGNLRYMYEVVEGERKYLSYATVGLYCFDFQCCIVQI